MHVLATGVPVHEIILFALLVAFFLYLDIRSGTSDKPVPLSKAALWSVIWVVISLCFAGYIAWDRGTTSALTFVTAYFLEKTLAVDNLFVFLAIFSSFSIAERFQHRILHWGILGALLFRGIFIGLGAGILFGAKQAEHLQWGGFPIQPVNLVFLFFGIFVLWSAFTLLKNVSPGMGDESADEEVDYGNHWSVRFVRVLLRNRIATQLDGNHFFTRIPDLQTGARRLAATPLFLCLIVIEISDIMFAFDSVPAIFAVTQETFLVYTSNIFAVLGLRSMYFLVTAAKRYLCHLEKAVLLILVFIGFKMVLFEWVHVKPLISLLVVLGLLAAGIAASLLWPETEPINESISG
ncbi:MAG: TerC/Alx family metal homeostasis membrane protein [Blastocatellia bacterium]|nr:TerC/Alx family metal homeostasis membrane protein [Blastocatellia bacterium]